MRSNSSQAKRVLSISLMAWLMMPPLLSADEQKSPEEVFSGFKEALNDGDGKRAVSLVSSNTIAAQEQLRQWSLELNRSQLEELDEMDVGNVLALRHVHRRRKLRENDGKGLLQGSLSKPEMKGFFEALKVGDFVIDGNVARADVEGPPDTEIKVVIQFRNENGLWKLDLEHFGKQSEWYGKLRKDLGMSKVDFAMYLLRKQHGAEKVSDKILDGPID